MKKNNHPGISTLATIIIVVLFAGVATGSYFIGKGKSDDVQRVPMNAQPEPYHLVNTSQNSTNETLISGSRNKAWVYSPDRSYGKVLYYSDWEMREPYFTKTDSGSGILLEFTLPTGSIITWGAKQSYCGEKNDASFQYGISTSACVKGFMAHIHPQSSQVEKNTFGEFVLKNQTSATDQQAQKLKTVQLDNASVQIPSDWSYERLVWRGVSGTGDGTLGYNFIPPQGLQQGSPDYITLDGFLQSSCMEAGQPGSLCDARTGLYTPSKDPSIIQVYHMINSQL